MVYYNRRRKLCTERLAGKLYTVAFRNGDQVDPREGGWYTSIRNSRYDILYHTHISGNS